MLEMTDIWLAKMTRETEKCVSVLAVHLDGALGNIYDCVMRVTGQMKYFLLQYQYYCLRQTVKFFENFEGSIQVYILNILF